jgi:DNA polymerase-3 subunit gamma/tau
MTVDTVHQLLGTAHEERVSAIADAVLAKDAKQALEILGDVVNQGQQLGELLDQLIEYWRDLMVVNTAGIKGQSVSVSSARRSILEQHAKQTNLDTILAGMDILVATKSRLRFSSHTRPLMEMAMVRLCQLDDLLPIGQIAQLLAKDGAATIARSPAPAVNTGVSSTSEKKKIDRTDESGISSISIELNDNSVGEVFQQLLSRVGFAVQSDLRKANSTAISGPNSLVIRVARRYNVPGSVFTDVARMSKVEETLSGIVGQPCRIRVEWTDDAPEAATQAGKSAAAMAMGQQRLQRAELLQIPFVKRVADVLGAQIVRADDGFGAAAKPVAADSPEVTEGE